MVCKDAGSSFYLSYLCKKNKNKYLYLLTEPALSIFKKELGNFKNYNSIKKLKNVDKIIFGTGKTNYEKKIMYSFLDKKQIIVYVDHWLNYKKRFTYKNKILRPSEVWVNDKKTLKLSKKYLTKITKLIPFNFQKLKKINKSNKINFLYLMGSFNKSKLDSKKIAIIKKNEKKALDKFLKFYEENFQAKKIALKIRLHPEEKNIKLIYKKVDKFKNLKFSKSKLIDEINISSHVFGANSNSMLIAEKLKKKLIICLDSKSQIINNYKKFNLINNFKI